MPYNNLLRQFGSCKPYWEKDVISRKIFISNAAKKKVHQLNIDTEKFLNGIQQLMEENNLHYAWISVTYGELTITFAYFPEEKEK
jgi:hypothetical protein